MIEPVGQVWLDGKVVDAEDSRVGLLTHSLHYGFGALDGFRSYRQDGGGVAAFRLADHLARLRSSASAIGLELGHTHGDLVEGACDVLRTNGLDDAYVRPLVFVGEPNIIFAHWLNPVHVALVPFAWSGYSDRDADAGTTAQVSPYPRPKAHAALYNAKLTGNYLLSVIAFGHARSSGVQQAIFLDEDGFVCESTGENLFAVHGNLVSTPPATRSLLPGLTRATVLVLAAELGYEVAERDLTVPQLHDADEVFTTGTASGVLAIPELDGRRIGDGTAPVARALRQRYLDAARGRLPEHADWLTIL
ncbi:branched-chain-amino-acid transaminase [Solihabitans fulvus]|uniref:Branched-chain-amino-acid aminotransferase n=1 Tax=Solihabitans fulvus TaxID=1892852 RepID=A0A5B2WQY0_9PSEU|nr:branched-chain-amino-acid transaminase [Solihabitans fulvus]KAA2253915.1 branched-chain-amino-acid transaminase [Solihabitans fulvus]